MTSPGRLVALVVAAAIVVVGLLALAALVGGPGRQTATGIVVAVEATSLTDVTGFSIRTADGRDVAFRIDRLENETTFPPGHLNEHRATSQPVLVTYREEDGTRVALRIDDAGAPP